MLCDNNIREFVNRKDIVELGELLEGMISNATTIAFLINIFNVFLCGVHLLYRNPTWSVLADFMFCILILLSNMASIYFIKTEYETTQRGVRHHKVDGNKPNATNNVSKVRYADNEQLSNNNREQA